MSNHYLQKDMVHVYRSGVCKILLEQLKREMRDGVKGEKKVAISLCLPVLRLLTKHPIMIDDMSVSRYSGNPVYEGNQILTISYTMLCIGNLSMVMHKWSAQEGVMMFNLNELIKSEHEMNLILEMVRTSRNLSVMTYGIHAAPVEEGIEAEGEQCGQTSTR